MEVATILQEVDRLQDENRGAEAEELMKQGIRSAVEEEDDDALLVLLNELIGYYRETSQAENSYQLADQAKKLMARMGLEGTIPYATTLLNIANAYRAGGRLQDSLQHYHETMDIYERLLSPDDMLVASLKNNISLLYQEMGDFQKAKECLMEALRIVERQQDAYFELAVTYANLAGTCLSLNQDEEAAGYFREAIRIFEAHGIEEAHYSAALASLATYEYKHGNYEEAARQYRKAMDCVRKSLGENEHYRRLQEYLAACEKKLAESAADEAEAAQAGVAESPTGGAAAGTQAGVAESPAGEAAEAAQESVAESAAGEAEATQEGEAEAAQEGGAPNGLALCRGYYEDCVAPMIKDRFPAYADRIAAGLVGEGSDCFGWDDAISRDHDWGPDVCLWVTRETWDEIGEALTEAYEGLPLEYRGLVRTKSARGAGRRGVQTIQAFYSRLLGENAWERPEEAKRGMDWRGADDASLAAATNGEVFWDPEGIFSKVRLFLSEGCPEEIRFLKLAQSAALFSQAGQYNYARVCKRGDEVTPRLLWGECLKEAMKLAHFAEGRFAPHDKWLWKSLCGLPGCRKVAELVLAAAKGRAEDFPRHAEELAQALAAKLYEKGFISDTDPYLDAHTEELLMKSRFSSQTDVELVEDIARLEFETFDKVRNVGGRADCQDDWYTFSIMRKSQYQTWDRTMLLQYLYDFHREVALGHNLITEKYGRMMESTAPEEYEAIKEHFPALSQEKKAIVEAIVRMQVGWMEEFEARYPVLAGNARSVHTTDDRLDNTSYETYLRGELSTYSDKMLELYGRYVVRHAQEGKNLTYEIMENSVKLYGYSGLEEAEREMAR